jgi:hypothetical protein
VEERLDVLLGLDAAAHRQRGEQHVRRARHDVQDDAALLVRRGDVEERDLVGALGVVTAGGLDGIAGVPQPHKADALHDAAVLDVEARDDALREHTWALAYLPRVGQLLRRALSPAKTRERPPALSPAFLSRRPGRAWDRAPGA